MAPDDIERASLLDRLARRNKMRAANYRDSIREALDLIEEAEGTAAGYAFRAAELRYDARGGMTAALAWRRFVEGRWTSRWTPGEVFAVLRQEERGGEMWAHFDRYWPEPVSRMTRANGWLFLDLPDLGGYR